MSLLRNVKMFYHKVHKEISQSAQSVLIQTVLFVFFVYTLCSLWLKAFFGVDSSFIIHNS